ncbi:MAG: DNA-binding response OmpR family regulator [Gammaproteobacteria bacterium]|jgi:DNA-binding response OmpR family regulator
MIKILCIENEKEQRIEIVDALTTEGFEVIEAHSASAGLKLILSEPIDLILCDRMMGGKSGYTLLEEIRKNHPDKENIPFVFLTGLDDRRDRLATAHLHPAAYITKPFEVTLLIEKIRSLTN